VLKDFVNIPDDDIRAKRIEVAKFFLHNSEREGIEDQDQEERDYLRELYKEIVQEI
jgi:hypothetical protein